MISSETRLNVDSKNLQRQPRFSRNLSEILLWVVLKLCFFCFLTISQSLCRICSRHFSPWRSGGWGRSISHLVCPNLCHPLCPTVWQPFSAAFASQPIQMFSGRVYCSHFEGFHQNICCNTFQKITTHTCALQVVFKWQIFCWNS